MIIVLSPSKTLDFETPARIKTHTQPELLAESAALIKHLRAYSQKDLSILMDISPKLAALNVKRVEDFNTAFTPANAKQAILAFTGDVYTGMDVAQYQKDDFTFAQLHLRILSGLYGVLRPLDLIQPYRLEMGTKLRNRRGKDLYAFWGDRITDRLNIALAKEKQPVLVNLASEEYFHAVHMDKLKAKILQVSFKENRKGRLQTIALFAKKARGVMADYVIKRRLTDVNQLKKFKEDGYSFEPSLSHTNQFIFVR